MPSREILRSFAPITLKEMDGVELMDRVDTKYVFGEALLPMFLDRLRKEYRLLEVNGRRGTIYRTLYFDTPGFRHFNDHQGERPLRFKVRYREYVGSDLCFLEVKRKTAKGRTSKVRMRVASIPLDMPDAHLAFVQEASGMSEPQSAQLWNTFERLTFVHHTRPERLTIDTGLTFERQGARAALGPACIAELKQQEGDEGSPFTDLMKDFDQRPTGMSKYCVGLWKLVPGMTYHAFKENIGNVGFTIREATAA